MGSLISRPWSLRRLWRRGWQALMGSVIGVGVVGAPQAAPSSPATTQGVPQEWMAYAGLVKAAIEATLPAYEGVINQRLQAASAAAGAKPSWVARVWVDRGGVLTALELEDRTGSAIEAELRSLLLGLPIGQAPPEGLRLPIVMRLDWVQTQDTVPGWMHTTGQ